ncbi:hypothetical protein VTJ04DRAFT_2237 [Mycothermus thermophilus]|uniref:uncharacterized protein n=1 Tax=Humicola insolens TaxID=85995 RepID=UPI00374370CC
MAAASELSAAMQRLHLDDETSFDTIDEILDKVITPKPQTQDLDRLRADLEAKYLAPSPVFSTDWLDRVQQRWDAPIDHSLLFRIAPTQSRTVTRFIRHGLEGRVTGYRHVTVPSTHATAKNSTSMLRKPAARTEFVRGGAGFFPFTPGGLDSIESAAALEDQLRSSTAAADGSDTRKKLEKIITLGEGGLLEVPPGLSRGIDFSKRRKLADAESEKQAKEVEAVLDQEPGELPGEDEDEAGERQEADGTSDATPAEDDLEDIDSILPVEFPALEPRGTLAASSARKAGREWAHMVDINNDMSNFRELVPDMAREWPFELDTFQKEAIYHLENGDSVFVAAHTSAGKTVVAEYAIALAGKHKTKAIYTSPIKALSNQKFRDFRKTFIDDVDIPEKRVDVGILTGDVQINPEASCLIMTTEILRSMLYRGADLIRDVEFVIFDEVHYVNDQERGVVWEEVIIMLPEHVSLILLSATVPNTKEFASWVGRTKQKDIYVISTPKRPVPLEHYLWANKNIYKIVDAEKKFIEKGWKEANAALQGKDKQKALPPAGQQSSSRGGANSGGRGGRGGAQQRGGGRGGGQQRGRGGPQRASHAPGHMGRTGRPGGFTSAAQDRTLWVHMVQFLKKQNLLPACIFVFSKKRCEENADALSNQDFSTAQERSAIHMTIDKSIARLKPEDRKLPQIIRMREMLLRGIAVHHGGLLPIVKELVEILFAQTLVKVLFATETFAMGLNLPTRTVVFSGCRKHDGTSFRQLLPGEYTQMAGRAGRRGLDPVGTVIIVPPGGDEAPPVGDLRQMILGEPSKLRSQFRLTYNMILNLLRVEALKIEEMIKRSFSEHATQQLLPETENQAKLTEANLAKVKRDPCSICDVHMDECHQAGEDYKRFTEELYRLLLANPVGRKYFSAGRLIVWMKDGVRTPGILLADGASIKSSATEPTLHILEIRTHRDARNDTDLLPFISKFRRHMTALPQARKHVQTKTLHIPLSSVVCLTRHITKGVLPEIFGSGETQSKAKDKLHQILRTPWTADMWDETDFGRVKALPVHDTVTKRREVELLMQRSRATECSAFLKHYAMCHDQWVIKTELTTLRKTLSEQNLQLLPDYEQRILVLRDLGFIDEDSRIQLKGKVACEIHSGDELVLTELILENVLADYDPAEIAALLSSFVFQEKSESAPRLTANLERGIKTIMDISERVNNVQTLHQVAGADDEGGNSNSKGGDTSALPKRFGLVEVVYEWARGMSFRNITNLTDVLEGTIVRTITRLDETCREVKNAARIIGDPELYRKMAAAQEMIRRDITAVASLYM